MDWRGPETISKHSTMKIKEGQIEIAVLNGPVRTRFGPRFWSGPAVRSEGLNRALTQTPVFSYSHTKPRYRRSHFLFLDSAQIPQSREAAHIMISEYINPLHLVRRAPTKVCCSDGSLYDNLMPNVCKDLCTRSVITGRSKHRSKTEVTGNWQESASAIQNLLHIPVTA